jgi:hypothetical protein
LDKKKFFAFLERYAEFCGKDETRSKQLGFKVKELIANDFFSGKDKEKVVKLLHTHGAKLNTFILYEMAVRDYELTLFSKEILTYTVDNLRDESLVRMGIVASKLASSSNTPEATAYFESIQAKLGELIETP